MWLEQDEIPKTAELRDTKKNEKNPSGDDRDESPVNDESKPESA